MEWRLGCIAKSSRPWTINSCGRVYGKVADVRYDREAALLGKEKNDRRCPSLLI